MNTPLRVVQERIRDAARAAGRSPEDVRLLAVSKSVPSSRIRELFVAGQRAFGESYVQEALDKQQELKDLAIEWHFIGPIQSNKARPIAEHFDWVHSVDRAKIAQRLNAARPGHLPPLSTCIQVNIGGEASKGGVAPGEALSVARMIRELPRLRLRGLMSIPRPEQTLPRQREQFRVLRLLRDELNQRGFDLDTLSMGMSDDLEAAVMEGATLVRIGTALFGERSPRRVTSS
jgi:hypothetical protein